MGSTIIFTGYYNLKSWRLAADNIKEPYRIFTTFYEAHGVDQTLNKVNNYFKLISENYNS